MILGGGQLTVVAVTTSALVAGAVVGLVWHHVAAARRSRLQAWAAARGWRYVGRDKRFFAIAPGPPFDAGFVRSMRHLMVGSFADSYVGIAFEFTNLEHQGRSFVIRTYSVVALQAPAPLPGVLLERETLLTRAETMVGGQDVEVESDEFNRAYRVRAVDARFASDLLNPRTMELLQRTGYPEFHVHGRYLVMHGRGSLDVDTVDPVLRLLARVCGHLPSFVWTDRGVEPPIPLPARPRPAPPAR